MSGGGKSLVTRRSRTDARGRSRVTARPATASPPRDVLPCTKVLADDCRRKKKRASQRGPLSAHALRRIALEAPAHIHGADVLAIAVAQLARVGQAQGGQPTRPDHAGETERIGKSDNV